MEILKCLRCRHEWIPRTFNKPKLCPSCKSKYWNQIREKKNADSSKGPRTV